MGKHSEKNGNITSPDFWIREWEKTLKGTPHKVHRGYSIPQFWDNLSKDYGYEDNKISIKQRENILSLFRANGFLFNGMRVLDIGCGTGLLAFALAHEGAEVTAVDFSEGMLNRLKEKCPEELKPGIHPVFADWNAVDIGAKGWERRFDLIVALMTPAIRRPEAFLKMLRVSRGACALKGWAGKRRNPILEELWQRLMGEEMKDRPPDIIFEFNLLYSMGYFPCITFEEVNWEHEVPVENLIKKYTDYFCGISDEPEEILRTKIGTYLESIAENGKVTEKNSGRTGIMFWRI